MVKATVIVKKKRIRPDIYPRISSPDIGQTSISGRVYLSLTIFLHGGPLAGGSAMDHDRKLFVQAEMLALIEGIPSSLVESHPIQFLLHLDQIRQKSAQHGLTALHDLSCTFESALQEALQGGNGQVTARSYLAAMKDAVACDEVDASMTEALMASVALRLGGQP